VSHIKPPWPISQYTVSDLLSSLGEDVKENGIHGRYMGKRYMSRCLVHWPQKFSCWPLYCTGCPIAEAYYCKGTRFNCAYFRISCYAIT